MERSRRAGARPAGPRPPPPRRRRRWERRPKVDVGVWALLGVGVLLRVHLLRSPIGELDGDSALTGLIGLHMAHGRFTAFFWGQAYGGTTESLAAAALFKVLPPSVVLIKVVPMLFSAASAVLVWRIGRRLVGERAGRLAAAFFWCWPFVFVWWSSKLGTYQSALTFLLAALLFLLRAAYDQGARWWDLAVGGLAIGLAWWASPQVACVLAPAGLFLLWRLLRHRLALLWVPVGAALGALPWFWFSVNHHWSTLDPPAQVEGMSYGPRLEAFFTGAFPRALGLNASFREDWLFGDVGRWLYAIGLAAFVVFALRDRRLRLPVFVALAYPFLYAVSTASWYVAQPRYVLFLMPFVAIMLGRAADSWWRGWIGVLACGTLALSTLVAFGGYGTTIEGDRIPDTAAAHALLREAGVTRAFADYWIAYRMTFEAREEVILSPVDLSRYKPYLLAVRAAPRPAYLFVDGSAAERRFVEALGNKGLAFTRAERGRWALVVPRATVLPEEVPEARVA